MFRENKDLKKKSTIQISEDLRNILNDLGEEGESYEDVLWKFIPNKNRRRGDLYNIEELKKIDKKLIDDTFERFNINLQDLEAELDISNEKINTEEVRIILKGIEYLCDNIDDLKQED